MENEIKNLRKAASRIKKAIEDKERIVIYGDADLDGVTSVIILRETIKNLGGETSAIYFPDRESEGYGISTEGLEHLKSFSPAFLVALDCGIGNFKEIKLAKKIGFKVIVIDHHEILDKLPEAEIVVDPKQKGDKYYFKGLATAGIVFKLSEILLNNIFTENLRENFLELVALATLADMMPRENENESFIEGGLFALENSWRPGIKIFFTTDYLRDYLTPGQKVSKMISILNVRDVENKLPASFRLFTSQSLAEAEKILEKLIEKSEKRREKINEIIKEIEERIQKGKECIIFEGDTNFDFTLISVVASILSQKFEKPAFIYKKLKEESQGTVRVPAGIDSVSLMKKCKKYLTSYGGHQQASGFRLKNENLEKFKKCLISHFKK